MRFRWRSTTQPYIMPQFAITVVQSDSVSIPADLYPLAEELEIYHMNPHNSYLNSSEPLMPLISASRVNALSSRAENDLADFSSVNPVYYIVSKTSI